MREKVPAISRGLLRILACPVCKGGLKLGREELVCKRCSQRYPIVDGIPHLLPPELMPGARRARTPPRR